LLYQGLDLPHILRIAQYQVPESLCTTAQRSGRAGRDPNSHAVFILLAEKAHFQAEKDKAKLAKEKRDATKARTEKRKAEELANASMKRTKTGPSSLDSSQLSADLDPASQSQSETLETQPSEDVDMQPASPAIVEGPSTLARPMVPKPKRQFKQAIAQFPQQIVIDEATSAFINGACCRVVYNSYFGNDKLPGMFADSCNSDVEA
jgi:superfamily II DNA/RNA helicase